MKEIDPVKFFTLIGWGYRLVGRSIIKAAIDDPDSEWDDLILELLDKVFGYTGDE